MNRGWSFTLILLLAVALHVGADPLPTGATVVSGAVGISTDTNTMAINQASASAIVNWESFSIGTGNAVAVTQPSADSAMLSRVIGADPSEILGSLTANGAFYLVNPNGIIFGPDAVVDVAKLIASTFDISDTDFLNGNLNFTGTSSAEIANYGTITAQTTILLAKQITNDGSITSDRIGLGACGGGAIVTDNANGGMITLDFSGVEAPDALVSNAGTIAPKTADDPTTTLKIQSQGNVSVTGNIETGIIEMWTGGEIRVDGALTATGSCTLSADGDITANGTGSILSTPLLNIERAASIGTTDNSALVTAVDQLDVTGVLGDVYITNVSPSSEGVTALTIDTAAADGAISINTSGDLTVTGDISSAGSYINLAAHAIDIDANVISGPQGDIVISAVDDLIISAVDTSPPFLDVNNPNLSAAGSIVAIDASSSGSFLTANSVWVESYREADLTVGLAVTGTAGSLLTDTNTIGGVDLIAADNGVTVAADAGITLTAVTDSSISSQSGVNLLAPDNGVTLATNNGVTVTDGGSVTLSSAVPGVIQYDGDSTGSITSYGGAADVIVDPDVVSLSVILPYNPGLAVGNGGDKALRATVITESAQVFRDVRLPSPRPISFPQLQPTLNVSAPRDFRVNLDF